MSEPSSKGWSSCVPMWRSMGTQSPADGSSRIQACMGHAERKAKLEIAAIDPDSPERFVEPFKLFVREGYDKGRIALR